jgi:hypothetical protein
MDNRDIVEEIDRDPYLPFTLTGCGVALGCSCIFWAGFIVAALILSWRFS